MDFNKMLVNTHKNETINFTNAIHKILEGKKIHKLEWIDKEYYALMRDYKLQLHKPDGKFYQWVINEGDMLGEDYIVI